MHQNVAAPINCTPLKCSSLRLKKIEYYSPVPPLEGAGAVVVLLVLLRLSDTHDGEGAQIFPHRSVREKEAAACTRVEYIRH
ncbi:hypothetical protein Trydic_g14231 [Trypoxylus dichotomus]